MIKKDVKKVLNGVNISFSGGVEKQSVVKMVENCQTGQCECMSEQTKQKIKTMHVQGKDGEVELHLSGDINKEEIEAALKKSKVIAND